MLEEITRGFTRARDLIFPHQEFLAFCKDRMSGITKLNGSSSAPRDSDMRQRPLSESNVVCSDARDNRDRHIPVLDLDVGAMLIPSSTPGHHHLYIDAPMSWEKYSKLLDVLAEVGILEQGYVEVSKKRKRTQVRTPWTGKW